MAQDSGYFGVRLGDAISSGAGHISNALQRKYEIQRREQEKKADLISQFETWSHMQKQRQSDEMARIQAEGAQKQAEPKPAFAIPPGYMPAPGGVAPIPGGPADVKTKATAQEKADKTMSHMASLEMGVNKIDEIIKNVGYGTSGLYGNIAKNIGGTSAANLEGDLIQLESVIGLSKLAEMKQESRTGASGMGQLSDREMQLLTGYIGNLKQKLSPDKLRSNLAGVKAVLSSWIERSKAQLGAQPAQPIQPVQPVQSEGWTPEKEQRYQQLLQNRSK